MMQNKKQIIPQVLQSRATYNLYLEQIKERLNADGLMREALRNFLLYMIEDTHKLMETADVENFRHLQGRIKMLRELLREFDL